MPHCHVHVCAEMRFEPAVRYKLHGRLAFRTRKNGAGSNEEADAENTFKRRAGLWRCAVPGCYCCALAEPAPEKKHFCPRCGKVSDAPKYRQAWFDWRCKACTRFKLNDWRWKRKASRTQIGGSDERSYQTDANTKRRLDSC